jgi:hypothetical protein
MHCLFSRLSGNAGDTSSHPDPSKSTRVHVCNCCCTNRGVNTGRWVAGCCSDYTTRNLDVSKHVGGNDGLHILFTRATQIHTGQMAIATGRSSSTRIRRCIRGNSCLKIRQIQALTFSPSAPRIHLFVHKPDPSIAAPRARACAQN